MNITHEKQIVDLLIDNLLACRSNIPEIETLQKMLCEQRGAEIVAEQRFLNPGFIEQEGYRVGFLRRFDHQISAPANDVC